MKRALLLIALCLFPLIAHSESAGEMLSNCREVSQAAIAGETITLPNTLGAGECWGAFATLEFFAGLLNREGKSLIPACLPERYTRAQLIAVFVKYAEDNPKLHHVNFGAVAWNALVDAFPCPP